MTKYESNIKQIAASQTAVYNKLADLRNLETLRERLNDPAFVDSLHASGQVPDDKLEQILQMASQLELSEDEVCINGTPLGSIALRIIERDDPKCIKFEAIGAPIQANLWIQLLPTSPYECKMRCTIGAELNFFMKQMAKKPLQEGVEKLADMLAMIPY